MKKMPSRIIVICILLSLLIVVSCDTNNLDIIHTIPDQKFTFSPRICKALFDCSPQEFFDLELDIYQNIIDFRTNARVSPEGNLVLMLSKKQRLALINSDLFDFSDYKNVEISYEDKTVIVNGFAETAYEDIKASLIIADRVCVKLLLEDDINDEEAQIQYIIRDGVTGEIVYSITWPQIEVHIPFANYNFSPLPE